MCLDASPYLLGRSQMYIRELPDPLMTHELFEPFIQAATRAIVLLGLLLTAVSLIAAVLGQSSANAMSAIQVAVSRLPYDNAVLLRYLWSVHSQSAACYR